MFQIVINEKGGQPKSMDFDKQELTIGRVQGNDIVLPKGNISKRHSRIVLKDGKFIIIDMQSTNGTYVNGKKITTPQVIKSTDKIYIGDYTLQLTGQNGEKAAGKGKGKEDEGEEAAAAASSSTMEAPKAAKPSGPGLLDESFDQEFEPEPAKGKAPPAATKKPAPAAKPAPEPEPEEEDEDEEEPSASDDDGGLELELSGGPSSPSDDDDEEEEEVPPPPPDEPEEEEPEEEEEPKPKAAAAPPKGKAPAAPPPKPAAKAPIKPALGKKKEEDDDLDLDTPPPAPPPKPEPKIDAKTTKPQPAKAPPAPEPKVPDDDEGDDLLDSATPQPVAPSAKPAPTPPPPAPKPAPAPVPEPEPVREPEPAPVAAAAPMAVATGPVAVGAVRSAGPFLEHKQLVRELHVRIADGLDLASKEIKSLPSMTAKATDFARKAIERLKAEGKVHDAVDVAQVAKEAAAAATDTGLIAKHYANDKVLELTITTGGQILLETMNGQGPTAADPIDSEAAVTSLIRCLTVLGGGDPDQPLIDVRLRDGARMVAALPPFSFRGPTLTLRKAQREAYSAEDLVANKSLSEGMMKLLSDYVLPQRLGILVAVGPGQMSSATLNALGSLIQVDERIVTIESGVELQLGHTNVVALQPSPKVSVSQLVEHAVARLPDRVIVGLVPGADAYNVLSAFCGPLPGSVFCYGASGVQEALDQLATRDLAGVIKDPAEARRLVARATPIVLKEERLNFFRYITTISELVVDGDDVRVEDIFRFEETDTDENGEIVGEFVPTGYTPSFLENVEGVDLSIFKA